MSVTMVLLQSSSSLTRSRREITRIALSIALCVTLSLHKMHTENGQVSVGHYEINVKEL